MNVSLDLAAMFVAAVSGAVAGKRKGMDWFGMYVVGLITGTGGGTLRSVLIGDLPPPVFRVPWYFVAAAPAVLLAWYGEPLWSRLRRAVSVLDALSLGLFVSVGVRVSEALGLEWWAAVANGVITATFGGVLRDVVRAEVPLIFRKELYATPCLLGGVLLAALDAHDFHPVAGTVVVTVFITAFRLVAIRYALNQSSA